VTIEYPDRGGNGSCQLTAGARSGHALKTCAPRQAAAAGVSSALRSGQFGTAGFGQVVTELSLDIGHACLLLFGTKGPVDGYGHGSGFSVFLQHPRQTILDNPIRMHEA
jgi:hypothetical protein